MKNEGATGKGFEVEILHIRKNGEAAISILFDGIAVYADDLRAFRKEDRMRFVTEAIERIPPLKQCGVDNIAQIILQKALEARDRKTSQAAHGDRDEDEEGDAECGGVQGRTASASGPAEFAGPDAIPAVAVLDRGSRKLRRADSLVIADHFLRHSRIGMLRSWRDTWYRFCGSHYAELPLPVLKAAIYRFVEQLRARDRLTGKLVPVSASRDRVSDIVDALKGRVLLHPNLEAPAWIDGATGPDPRNLLICRNGILDVPSGQMLAHTPQLFATNALAFDYDPNVPRPVKWLRFLDELFAPDAQDAAGSRRETVTEITLLQEIGGYLLLPDTRLQKIVLFIGPDRSGKGTIARVFTQLIGPANVVNPTMASLGQNFGLWPLIGKRVAIIGDARLSGDTSHLVERLLSISGEDALTIDRKNLSAWTGRLSTRFLVITNVLPRLSDTSSALARRFVILPFRKSFYGKENLGLTDELLAELPGMLLWVLEGWRRLNAAGAFSCPDSTKEAAEDLERVINPLKAFMEECCEIGDGKEACCADVFDAWSVWCERNGWDRPGTSQSFGRNLRSCEASVQTVKRSRGSRGRFYVGLALTQEAAREATRVQKDRESSGEYHRHW